MNWLPLVDGVGELPIAALKSPYVPAQVHAPCIEVLKVDLVKDASSLAKVKSGVPESFD
jgi:hypothetical protein